MTEPAAPPVPAAKVRELLAKLRPMEGAAPLLRLGDWADGGYLVPDDLTGIAGCFSPGVDAVATFESDLAKRGIPSFLADYSVEGPPPGLPGATFLKKFLTPKDTETSITLTSWLAQCDPDPGADLILQMDIEGAEYPVLPTITPEVLRRFRIIVMEVHALHHWERPQRYRLAEAMLRRLTDDFTVVHVHPNNCCGVVEVAGLTVPTIVEVTFHRNDRVRVMGPARRFPHPLDVKNVQRHPDLVLPSVLWADDSPLFAAAPK